MKKIYNKQYKNFFISITLEDDYLTKLSIATSLPINNDYSKIALEIFKQLDEYFEGNRVSFDIKTKIKYKYKNQQRFTQLLKKVPYSETLTYSQMAQELGSKNLSRNTGFLCGKNPIPIIIPCHRIVAAKGIGGYSAGVNIKSYLPELETQP